MFIVEMALAWLGIGSLVAAGVLIDHLLSARRFPERVGWRLIPTLTIAWPWPVWVWYATRSSQTGWTDRAFEIGLPTMVVAGALSFGWMCGSNLYTVVYPQEPELANEAAVNAMVERIIDAESNAGLNAKNEEGAKRTSLNLVETRR
jgi:hypothetical protein